MKTRLITLLLGALIALPSYAQDLRSIAMKIIKTHPIEQLGSQDFTTVFQNRKVLQLQENIGEEGSHCYDFALWRSEETPQKYLIALAYRILPEMRDGQLLFFYHSPQSDTQRQINLPIKVRTYALNMQEGEPLYWRSAMGILKGGTIWQNASASMASTDYVFYRKKEGKDAFEEVPYMTFFSPISVVDYTKSMKRSSYIDRDLRPYVERINRSKTLKKRLLLTASEQAEYLPNVTFFFEGDKLVKAVHHTNGGVSEYYFRNHCLLFIYNKTKTKEHRIYLNEGSIVRYLGSTPWDEDAIEALYDRLITPLIPNI